MKARKENVSQRGSKAMEKQTFKRFIQWWSLFSCVKSIFATFEIGGYLSYWPKLTQIGITFNKFCISSCIIKLWIDDEKLDLIALTVFEI